ncbi:probable CoA ligase CCL5 [Andrographis paniculata]|uniref:probable CoA ligase CCL5 n=1 Tax=Andrographis paniculata TaxID=175694 RepID=UPI0021E8DE03|nr:probable CoA ligase CCL5 [Andrographis paniculata]
MAENSSDSYSDIDPRSGFCRTNRTFYSKRNPVAIPSNQWLDATTYISARPHRATVAFIDAATGHRLTFPDLWRAVESVATSLSVDLAIRKGQTVLILSPNSIEFPIVFLAVISIGAVVTTANPLLTSDEIQKQIADSKPVLAFTTLHLIPKLAASNLPIVLLRSGAVKLNRRSDALRIVDSIEEMMNREVSRNRVKERVHQDDAATLLYSSGTTGASKGVVTTHRNLIAITEMLLQRLGSDEEKNRIMVCTVPMFHIYGVVAFATGLIAAGATVVVLPKFDMHELLTAIQNFSVNYLPLVPPILVALTANAKKLRNKYDLSSLKIINSGGAPLSKEVTEEFLKLYPNVMIRQSYGLTESTAVGASSDTMDECRKHGSAGLLSPNMAAKIADPETGESLPVNRTGELWLKGPAIMKGYFRNEEATNSTLDSEGWLRTGDLCYIDEDGFLFVVDRIKELIKYNGYQVPPAELEALLLGHPEIEDVAVIPFPDKDSGQIPMAYLVRKSGSKISETEVMEWIAKKVAPYKKIRRVAFISSIARNPAGKILRKDLIKLATATSSKI